MVEFQKNVSRCISYKKYAGENFISYFDAYVASVVEILRFVNLGNHALITAVHCNRIGENAIAFSFVSVLSSVKLTPAPSQKILSFVLNNKYNICVYLCWSSDITRCVPSHVSTFSLPLKSFYLLMLNANLYLLIFINLNTNLVYFLSQHFFSPSPSFFSSFAKKVLKIVLDLIILKAVTQRNALFFFHAISIVIVRDSLPFSLVNTRSSFRMLIKISRFFKSITRRYCTITLRKWRNLRSYDKNNIVT